MPKLWLAQQLAQKCLHKAYERFMRGFSNLSGGQDRLVWLDGRTRRSSASGSATCCVGEAGFRVGSRVGAVVLRPRVFLDT